MTIKQHNDVEQMMKILHIGHYHPEVYLAAVPGSPPAVGIHTTCSYPTDSHLVVVQEEVVDVLPLMVPGGAVLLRTAAHEQTLREHTAV